MNLKCYVVDDMPAAVESMSRYVQRTEGLELAGAATNPIIALAEINRLRPDIVITDINMPEMSGIELAGKIDGFAQIIIVSGEPQFRYRDVDWKSYLYLMKVVSYEKFSQATSLIRSRRG